MNMLKGLCDLWIHFMVVVFSFGVFFQTSCASFELVDLVTRLSLYLHSPLNFLNVLSENLKDYRMCCLSWS